MSDGMDMKATPPKGAWESQYYCVPYRDQPEKENKAAYWRPSVEEKETKEEPFFPAAFNIL